VTWPGTAGPSGPLRRAVAIGLAAIAITGIGLLATGALRDRPVEWPLTGHLVLGTYKFGACADCEPHFGPAGFDSYAAWLNNDQLKYAQDNTGDDYWARFEQGWIGSFEQWQKWKEAAPGRRLVLAVPFFAREEPGDDRSRIAACARGGYDGHYAALARNLEAENLGDSILRIAWEANQDWAPWSYHLNPDDWRACWRRVAQTMKAVTPTLLTNWNVSADGAGATYMREAVELRGFDNFYPGDDVVDEIGIDFYGAPQIRDWDLVFSDQVGTLGWFVALAKQHGKPLSVPEWGLWDNAAKDWQYGSRDDPVYIEQMFFWLTDPANGVAWASYFDVNVDAETQHQLQPRWGGGTVFPKASARFRELFGRPVD
jgi:hypothetical protein